MTTKEYSMVDTKDTKDIKDSKKQDKKGVDDAAQGVFCKDTETAIVADNNNAKALDIINRNAYWSAGVGLLPVPALDIVGVTAVQLKMVNELTKLYAVPFSSNAAKTVIVSLLGGIASTTIAYGSIKSVLKSVPVVGPLAGLAFGPTVSGAVTWAVGRVFAYHFASGGNLFNLDPAKAEAYFQEQFEQRVNTQEKKAA